MIGKQANGTQLWAGYAWLKDCSSGISLENLFSSFSIGGERRNGFGRMSLDSSVVDSAPFGMSYIGTANSPQLCLPAQAPLLAHLSLASCHCCIHGEIEPLVGREWHSDNGPGHQLRNNGYAWMPGSQLLQAAIIEVGSRGVWHIHSPE